MKSDRFSDVEIMLYGYFISFDLSSFEFMTDDDQLVTVFSDEYKLKELTYDMIQKKIGLLVSAKQNIETYEFKHCILIKFIEYSTQYDKDYLNQLQNKGTEDWSDIEDINNWLRNIRY